MGEKQSLAMKSELSNDCVNCTMEREEGWRIKDTKWNQRSGLGHNCITTFFRAHLKASLFFDYIDELTKKKKKSQKTCPMHFNTIDIYAL